MNLENRTQSKRLLLTYVPVESRYKALRFSAVMRDICITLPISEEDCKKIILSVLKIIDMVPENTNIIREDFIAIVEDEFYKVVKDSSRERDIRYAAKTLLNSVLSA